MNSQYKVYFVRAPIHRLNKKRTKYSNINEIDQKSYIMQTKIIIVNYVSKQKKKKKKIGNYNY